MNNEPLNIDLLPPGFMRAAQAAWCRETCWPGCVQDYPAARDDNPSFGNCLVTVLAAWAARGFAGKVIPGKVDETAWHFRLGLPGGGANATTPVDPTWQQFDSQARFRELACDTPENRAEYREVVVGSLWDDPSLTPRLQLLIERMRGSGGYDVGASARDIIDAVQSEFRFVFSAGFIAPRPPLPGLGR